MGLSKAVALSVGNIFGHLLLSIFGVRLAIFQVRRGSPFLTQLRLEWMTLASDLRSHGHSMPITVQLLGTVDDMVSPEDNIDLVTGRDFFYLDVPHSGHGNVIE